MFRGTVAGVAPSSPLMVEIDGIGASYSSARTEIGSQGSFAFMGVPPGQYVLKIVDIRGNIVYREFVDVGRDLAPVHVQLPQQEESEPARGGVISVHRLQHKVPKEARKEFDRAEKAVEKGNVEESIAHLEKATELDPEFVEAYVNLGARRLRLNQPASALTAFEKALAIDANLSIAYSNAATALLMLRRAPEAETAAEKAIEINPTNARARYMLGVALLQQAKEHEKALDNLQRACDEFPIARLPMAQGLAALGRNDEAKALLEEYLESGRTEMRAEAQTMLSGLARQQVAAAN